MVDEGGEEENNNVAGLTTAGGSFDVGCLVLRSGGELAPGMNPSSE